MKKTLVIASLLTLAVSSSLIAADSVLASQNKSVPKPRPSDPFSGLFGAPATPGQPNNQWWMTPPVVSMSEKLAAKCMKVVTGDPNLDPDIRRNPRAAAPKGAKAVEPTMKVVVPPPCIP